MRTGFRRAIAGMALAGCIVGAAVAQDSFQGMPAPQGQFPQAGVPQRTPQIGPQGPAPGALELQDFGVAATGELHAGPMHGPTPTTIPGGRVITTQQLVALVNGREPHFLFDVLGGAEALPKAIPAAAASQPGSFDDSVQQTFGQFLQQGLGNRRDIPLVFYCQSPHCWMSYNAALRAIRLGYANVFWYRGGLEAWKAAGLPTNQAVATGGGPSRSANLPGR